MFCTTTTPFAIQDAAAALAKPTAQVENAWKIQQPYFGTQLTFGFGRIVPAPNFFDVVAMGVMIELLSKPCDLNDLVAISTCVTEEVAICMDHEDPFLVLGDSHRTDVINHLIAVFSCPQLAKQHRLLTRRCVGIVAVVAEIMEQVYEILIDGCVSGLVSCNTLHVAVDRIA
ncbi:hypothetical protein [Ruegeria lacuscaerulensis]|uniref:hypothetical protein n=1 Tax=Ruegeria lacuscaerulensis TaxID=55218 RepID=UPI001481BC7D|nr:hypothetical protein [Ruegeria lacuscaerulensis]